MKCPKCGYNSFEYLDQCKKCSHDLTTVKKRCGIKVMLQPPIVRSEAESAEPESVAEPALPVAPEPVVPAAAKKPTDLFDLGVFSASSFGAAPAAAKPEEIVMGGKTLPPPTNWAEPEVLGRREEFDEGEETSSLLLEEMISLEEVTPAEKEPPVVFEADSIAPVLATQEQEENEPAAPP